MKQRDAYASIVSNKSSERQLSKVRLKEKEKKEIEKPPGPDLKALQEKEDKAVTDFLLSQLHSEFQPFRDAKKPLMPAIELKPELDSSKMFSLKQLVEMVVYTDPHVTPIIDSGSKSPTNERQIYHSPPTLKEAREDL